MRRPPPDAGEAVRNRTPASAFLRSTTWLLSCVLVGCASHSGRGLEPGLATLDDVTALMGPPAHLWTGTGNRAQLSYPRGPAGLQSYMVFIDSRGRLDRIENVLTDATLAKVVAGMSREEVLRLVGPPVPEWTAHFSARRELAWEWRYCNDRSMTARFHALFDSDTGRVRSTMTFDETGPEGGILCAR